MRYNEQINLKLYKYENSSFVLQAIIDDYQEISFSYNLYEAGDFTITINYNIPNALKFERGMWIQFGNDSYMFGEILTITDSIGADGKGSQIRTITGKDARFIFKRRIIKNLNNEENWAMTAKGELCLRELVKAQCGSGAETKRQLPITNIIPQLAVAIGKEYSVAEAFSNLYDTLVTIATQSEIGWRVKFDGSLTLEVYQGSDLSNQVQFSTKFDSLANGQFTDSAEAYANTIYVGGKGTGSDRDIYEGEIETEGETPEGIERYEAWDNQSEMTSESEYEAEALSMLTQYGQTLNISGQGLAQCPYIFKEQYNIGDTITLAFSGKSAKAQILSVTEHWTWGQYGISFSFGKPQNDLARQLQLILKQIQKASSKTETTSSVKYYTIPTDTEQPKADVIYDTIGFEGACASGGSTFKLYYDSEKTGAKTYHVWFKQLGGGKLTLTTGVTGKANLILNSGTYVAIIYVDAEGNVLSQGATATGTIESGNTQPATSDGVAGAISTTVQGMSASSVGGSGKYIESISETNGVISATEQNLDTTATSGSNKPITSGAVVTAITNAINALDVAAAGGNGKYIKSISESNGKISATEGTVDSSVTSGSNNPVTGGAVASAINVVKASVSDIEALIPSQATTQNQLADKNFVNSSIATNTANFLGTYTTLADIQAIQNPTNNDYAFLQTTDQAGNSLFDRYKYNAEQNEWLFEYELNNSSFTAEQWATINSGLTSTSISDAINALDVAQSGGNGKYIESISESNGKISATEKNISDLILAMYPVGSIYWTGKAPNNGGNPATLFGGTWIQIKDRFIWAKGDSDTLGATGGAKTVTLTLAQMPSHSHTTESQSSSTTGNQSANENFSGSNTHNHELYGRIRGGASSISNTYPVSDHAIIGHATSNLAYQDTVTISGTSKKIINDKTITISGTCTGNHTHSFAHTHTTDSKGGGESHDNMPPYIVKYCWERTA